MQEFCGIQINLDLNIVVNKSSVMATDIAITEYEAEKAICWVPFGLVSLFTTQSRLLKTQKKEALENTIG